jgi:hypothetical protein
VQIDQSGKGNARRTKYHPCAGSRIQHPGRHGNHLAWRDLDVNYVTRSALLAVMPTNATPKQRMPPVMDLDFPPDMGRMFGRWL